MAYARARLGNDEAFDLSPRFVRSIQEGERVARQPGRHVFLFSDYLWSFEGNLELSRRVKEINPRVVTIHGGANIPAYPGACEEYLRAHGHVDFAVRGEGETTLVDLLLALRDGDEKTRAIPNVSTLVRGRFVQHEPRERARDLDVFPSPYLEGIFDSLNPKTFVSATIESNRGCPYGCTFCDWGAAILQKIRTFSLERVRAEVEWIARNEIPAMWIADANYGVLPRDVEIARIIAESKKRTGYPKRLTVQYAKNTHQHLVEIIEIFLEAGLISTGIVSLQTRDPKTLEIVRRKNIKTREYDKLKSEFQKRGLPLATQLMIGLPGATISAFKDDLRAYFDEPIETQIFRTIMLVGSPMADPAYREAHRIRVREDGLVTETATMTSQEYDDATLLARIYNGVHIYGMLRYPLRFLGWEHGIDAIDLMHELATDRSLRATHPLLWEMLDATGYDLDLSHTHVAMRERFRRENLWRAMHEQFCSWLGPRLPRDPAWSTILRVQEALMPAAGRTFPDTLALEHDVVRWYADRRAGKATRLRDTGPGTLTVEDPLGFSNRTYTMVRATRLQWELASELAALRAGRPGEQSPEALRLRPGVWLPWAIVSADPAAL